MARRYSSSGAQQKHVDIINVHRDMQDALLNYFLIHSATSIRFVGYTQSEIWDELNERLAEADHAAALALLAAIEAAFRVDYLSRAYQKKRTKIGLQPLFESCLTIKERVHPCEMTSSRRGERKAESLNECSRGWRRRSIIVIGWLTVDIGAFRAVDITTFRVFQVWRS